MKLLVDMQGAQNDSRFRGIGRYVNALLTHLIQAKSDNDVILLLLNGELVDGESDVKTNFAPLLSPENIFVWYPLTPTCWENFDNFSRRMASQAIRDWAIREVGPDCVLISSLFEGCGDNVVTSVATNDRPPIAVIFYDLIPFLYPDHYLGNAILRQWYADRLSNLKKADCLLSISEASRQDAIGYLGISGDRITNISSGIDTDLFQTAGAYWPDVAAKFGVPDHFLLYVGAADPRKNLEALFRAFGRLSTSEAGELSLILIGRLSDDQIAGYQELIKTLAINSKSVFFVGHVSDGELIAFYRKAQVFVFPSLHEGFGLPPLEAMAAGCPVITSNCSTFPEVVGIREAMFDPFSVESIAALMGKVICDAAFRDWLIQEQRSRVALFSWGDVATRAWAAVRKLVGESGTTKVIDRVGRGALIEDVAMQLGYAGAALRDYSLASEAIARTLASLHDNGG